jgi:hypothetical protein
MEYRNRPRSVFDFWWLCFLGCVVTDDKKRINARLNPHSRQSIFFFIRISQGGCENVRSF